ncbi:uncharacterized protein LOC129703714 [Leucoraja erinacea]|uniref:uncharacterized protein LOC129703714 n=1 Tax=Leucoraja erinaceus TaxID=7782 RepID=UPI002458BE67|nr:uncharacterized protein LOC129703714 [Leucoraja erinacea]
MVYDLEMGTEVFQVNSFSILIFFPDTYKRLKTVHKSLTASKNEDAVTFATGIFVPSDLVLEKSFIKQCSKIYKAEPTNVNFAESEAAASIINTWANSHTKGTSSINLIIVPKVLYSAHRLLCHSIMADLSLPPNPILLPSPLNPQHASYLHTCPSIAGILLRSHVSDSVKIPAQCAGVALSHSCANCGQQESGAPANQGREVSTYLNRALWFLLQGEQSSRGSGPRSTPAKEPTVEGDRR